MFSRYGYEYFQSSRGLPGKTKISSPLISVLASGTESSRPGLPRAWPGGGQKKYKFSKIFCVFCFSSAFGVFRRAGVLENDTGVIALILNSLH